MSMGRPDGLQRGRRGVTLVELMISLVLIGVGLVGVMCMYSQAASTNEYARHASQATIAAQSVLERVQSMTYADLEVSAEPYDVTSLLPSSLPEASGTMLVEQYAPSLKQVTVTVQWRPGRITGGRIRMTTLVGPKAA